MVKANIVIPKKLTAEQKDMIKKLADSLGDKVSEAKVGKKTIFDKVKKNTSGIRLNAVGRLYGRPFVLPKSEKCSILYFRIICIKQELII